MNTIKSNMTRHEAAAKIVAALKNHYLRTESDIAIGFTQDGDVDFDYLSGGSDVKLVYFATNNGFTFNIDEDPSEEAYWAEEAENGWLVEYIADDLRSLEFDDLIEFA
jgi:hypothetical protein